MFEDRITFLESLTNVLHDTLGNLRKLQDNKAALLSITTTAENPVAPFLKDNAECLGILKNIEADHKESQRLLKIAKDLNHLYSAAQMLGRITAISESKLMEDIRKIEHIILERGVNCEE